MSPRRRHAYSPTDARDLADGMYAARDRSGRSDRLYSSQMLNNSSSYADHRYTPPHRGAPDNRYSDANRRGDDIQVVRVAGRQVPSGLPNGYKPGQGSGRTPDLHLRKQVLATPSRLPSCVSVTAVLYCVADVYLARVQSCLCTVPVAPSAAVSILLCAIVFCELCI